MYIVSIPQKTIHKDDATPTGSMTRWQSGMKKWQKGGERTKWIQMYVHSECETRVKHILFWPFRDCTKLVKMYLPIASKQIWLTPMAGVWLTSMG